MGSTKHGKKTMVARALAVAAVCLMVSDAVSAETELGGQQQPAESEVQPFSRVQSNLTAVTARLLGEYITPTICTYAPDYCTKHELHSSRGIQSYLATAGTLFAGVLGVMFTKIKILVIVSLMTMLIGKMLLFYAFLKADFHHHHHKPHHHHVPFVKYTKDKYYIKHTPSEHSSDVYVDEPHHSPHSPYHGHAPGGVSYFKR